VTAGRTAEKVPPKVGASERPIGKGARISSLFFFVTIKVDLRELLEMLLE
jgi:hypothetical protein